MTWGQAQAGNRASKTRPYLQWWVNKSEQDVRSSALQNLHHSARFFCRSPHHRGPPTNPAVKGSCMPYTHPMCVCVCVCARSRSLWIACDRLARSLSSVFSFSCCTCPVHSKSTPATLLKHLGPLGRCHRLAGERRGQHQLAGECSGGRPDAGCNPLRAKGS